LRHVIELPARSKSESHRVSDKRAPSRPTTQRAGVSSCPRASWIAIEISSEHPIRVQASPPGSGCVGGAGGVAPSGMEHSGEDDGVRPVRAPHAANRAGSRRCEGTRKRLISWHCLSMARLVNELPGGSPTARPTSRGEGLLLRHGGEHRAVAERPGHRARQARLRRGGAERELPRRARGHPQRRGSARGPVREASPVVAEVVRLARPGARRARQPSARRLARRTRCARRSALRPRGGATSPRGSPGGRSRRRARCRCAP